MTRHFSIPTILRMTPNAILRAFIHRPCGLSEGEIGDTNARVLFTFLPSALQDLVTPA